MSVLSKNFTPWWLYIDNDGDFEIRDTRDYVVAHIGNRQHADIICAAPDLYNIVNEYVINCPKCHGDGWVWGDELDSYDVKNAPIPDDTQYSCDYCHKARIALNRVGSKNNE